MDTRVERGQFYKTMSGKMHFVTGKGGVGKSTYAASLATQLAQNNPAQDVLLIDIQGSGYALETCSIARTQHQPFRSSKTPNLWGCRILPLETFKEYFTVLLALGNTDTPVAQITSGLRGKVVEMVLGNSAISAFVHACPGLEPAVLLGKLEYECKKGQSPNKKLWSHVIVDAPATGHALMLFRSTFALMNVFSAGTIFKQAREIKEFVLDPKRFEINLVSIPEELPVAESGELKKELASLGLVVCKAILNRSPLDEQITEDNASSPSPALQKELAHEQLLLKERRQFRKQFLEMHSDTKIIEIPEFISATQDEVNQKWQQQTRLT
jgi:anion-transporting  ArsA/GET3 family ATPase